MGHNFSVPFKLAHSRRVSVAPNSLTLESICCGWYGFVEESCLICIEDVLWLILSKQIWKSVFLPFQTFCTFLIIIGLPTHSLTFYSIP